MVREQRRLAAIVSADVAGYSRLMGHNESATLAALKILRRDVVDPQIATHGGRIVKTTGDGLLLEFPSVVDAVRCVVEVQTAMAARGADVPDDQRIAFRIGINLGDVIVDDDDIFGDGVNIAARLQELASPGGMCVSSRVHDDVCDRLDLGFEDGGTQALKNIARPVQVWRWLPGASSQRETAVTSPLDAKLAEADKPSIAVLPFKNMSGDPEQEYFVDGLVEDITIALSRVSWIFVIARNLSSTYKGRPVDVRQVGRDLGVRYVLEGSVRKADNRLRIGGELTDAVTGNQIWADRYDGALEDVFGLQDRITSNVVAAIAPKVMRVEIARAQAKPTNNLTAYDLYLRALALCSEYKAESDLQALTLLYRAIELDPSFASAYGRAANCHLNRLVIHGVPVGNEKAQGLEAARRAVEVGQDDPDALARGGLVIAILGERPKEGLPYLERALALNPNSLLVNRFAGFVFGMVGDHAKAIALHERALQLSPLDAWADDSYFGIALVHFFAGRFEESVGWADKALAVRPASGVAALVKIAAMAGADHPVSEVREIIRRWPSPPPISAVRQRMWGYVEADVDAFAAALRKAGLPE